MSIRLFLDAFQHCDITWSEKANEIGRAVQQAQLTLVNRIASISIDRFWPDRDLTNQWSMAGALTKPPILYEDRR